MPIIEGADIKLDQRKGVVRLTKENDAELLLLINHWQEQLSDTGLTVLPPLPYRESLSSLEEESKRDFILITVQFSNDTHYTRWSPDKYIGKFAASAAERLNNYNKLYVAPNKKGPIAYNTLNYFQIMKGGVMCDGKNFYSRCLMIDMDFFRPLENSEIVELAAEISQEYKDHFKHPPQNKVLRKLASVIPG